MWCVGGVSAASFVRKIAVVKQFSSQLARPRVRATSLLTADCCLLVPPTEAARGPWQPLQHEEAAEAASGGIAARYILVTTATTT